MNNHTVSRRTLLIGGAAAAGGLALSPLPASAAPPTINPSQSRLVRWARDTWRSLDAMAHQRTGLVSDAIQGDLTRRVRQTSPTDIGGYLWSCIVARDLRLITRADASARIARTLRTLAAMEHHEPSGMYYNWYDINDGSVLHEWPDNGDVVVPFVSSVDMGWLGAALYLVANADRANRPAALALYNKMRWDVFFDRDFSRQPGAIYGGFYTVDPKGQGVNPDVIEREPLNGVGGPNLWYTQNHHYDTCVSEARMALYLGIIRRQIPGAAFYATFRTFPADWDWQEQPPRRGVTRTYLGVEVYEASYRYGGRHVVPGWGGSMFEELMPDLFVPEEDWAPRSWGRNHPNHVAAQIYHGLKDAKYGYWGFSPSSNPYGGYREYGVDALGLKPDGYFSDQEETDWHWQNPPTRYGDGVVTPHASFLAMMHDRGAATANLVKIQNTLRAYGPGGFYDAIGVRSGRIARRYLSLDQAMIMGALGNVQGRDLMRRYFATAEVARALRPVIGPERFSI